MTAVKVEISGIKEAIKILESFKPREQKKVIENAIRRSIAPMISAGKSAYRSKAHPYSGVNRKMRAKYGVDRGATALGSVKLKRGVIGYRAKPINRKGGQLVHLLDLGTGMRKTSAGHNRGLIRKWGYWSNAIRQHSQRAISSAQQNITKALESKINSSIKKFGIKV